MSGAIGQHKWLELENDIKPVPKELLKHVRQLHVSCVKQMQWAHQWVHQWVHTDPLAISTPNVRIHPTRMSVCYLVTLKNVICLEQR